MERRKGLETRSSSLPVDYLKMVTDVFTTNFDEGLKALRKHLKGKLSFQATGAIFSDEIILCVTILEKDAIAATSVYASF